MRMPIGLRFRKALLLLTALTITFLAVITAYGHGRTSKVINVNANAAGTELVTSDNGCLNHPRRPDFINPGCIRVSWGEDASMDFRLTGPNEICDAAAIPPERWVLDGLQLGNKNQLLKPTNAQWLAPTALLDAEVQRDFKVDPWTGWATLQDPPTAGADLTVVNRNLSENGYVIWYRLRATCATTNAEIFLDPRIDNEGEPQ